MSLMDSREFVIQQAENLAQSLKENHVLMGKNEELVKENLTVQKQLSACQQECQRLRSQAFAAGRAAASHATQNDEKVALKIEAYEELEAEAARTNNMLRKALNSLTASSTEKEQLLAEHRRCLEEKAALGQQLEHLSHHTAQQRTAWSTEANALRRQLEQYQNAGQNKDEKFRAAQAMVGNLQAQLAEKAQTLEECQQLVVELQVAQTDIHMENNLAIDRLVDSERTALQELEHAQAQRPIRGRATERDGQQARERDRASTREAYPSDGSV
ncbi:hypothetical protein B0H21DRAFT_299952 [Amylocystis lapponica]|nr:hypothetical protein B0H21DRAFT_299952 [Amylocystis lapponica]